LKLLGNLGAFIRSDMMRVGYARVSTDGQDTTGQIAQLNEAGCKSIFSEKQSGAKTDRPGLAKALAALEPGDVLVVTKLDRLARSMRDLLNILQQATDKGAGFIVLDTPALDTTNAYGQLLLNVLGALAQFERTLILSRTREGRQRYLANGGKLGRKAKLSPTQVRTARTMRELGSSLAEIGAVLGVAHTTVVRALAG
jgi:DNA invertase Pin-like site-specific DNA recombinase